MAALSRALGRVDSSPMREYRTVVGVFSMAEAHVVIVAAAEHASGIPNLSSHPIVLRGKRYRSEKVIPCRF